MKVLYITNDSGLSGSTIALKNLLSYLIPHGVEAYCICRSEGDFTEWCLSKNIPYSVFPYNWNCQPLRTTFRDKLAYYWRIYKYYQEEKRCMDALEKVCKEFHPDIIHTNNGIIHWGYKLAKKIGVKHVWHLREYQDKDFSMTPIPSMKAFCKMAQDSHCICITQGVQDYFHLEKGNSCVIYDGVLPMHSSRYCMEKEDYFLFVGRIEPSKGIEELLHAYYEYNKRGGTIPLWIAGSGKPLYIQERMNEAEKYSSSVKFLGFRSDRLELMYKAKATIVPSRFEGFGFITVEAIMNGCFVIGHNAGGTSEIAKECKSVYLYDTEEDLVNLLVDIECNLDLMEKSQEYAELNYTNEVSAAQVLKFYQAI